MLWIETLISGAEEETRLYLFKAYKLLNLSFVFLVIEKDISHYD